MRARTAMPTLCATLALFVSTSQATQSPASSKRFSVDDLARLVDLTEPTLSPDGRTVAYTATSANLAEDQSQEDDEQRDRGDDQRGDPGRDVLLGEEEHRVRAG